MKMRWLMVLGLSFVPGIGGGEIVWAQAASASSTIESATTTAEDMMTSVPSATSTIADAASAAKVIAPATTTVINSEYSFPEWHQEEPQSFIWRGADGLIRQGVSRLALAPAQTLPVPILFGVTPAKLAQNFGDPRGSGRKHEGLDIIAPKATPVVSPTPAVVLSTGFGAGSGYYATTANPGGETFVYMHLDRPAQLTAGTILRAGDLIGYAGNTGNAAGGGTHLHFEIRKNGATDPFARLKEEFTLAQKISFLENILAGCNDKTNFAKFMASTYPEEFKSARASNISLPAAIEAAMAPAATGATAQTASPALGAGLGIGARGSEVAALQNLLIAQNKGPAAAVLARTGATGYFGPLTRDALAEYNAAAKTGITATAATTPAAKMTAAQIKIRIAQIQTLIINLQKQLLEMRSQTT